MRYAIINNGIVENIIVLTPQTASEFPNSVACGDYPVAIGDTYENGVFYHDGEPLQTIYAGISEMEEALKIMGVTE